MTESGDVLVRSTLRRESLAIIKQLVWEAVNEALTVAAGKITDLQNSAVSQVPIDTGRLRRSFKVAISPGQLLLHWSAIDPRNNFDYALVQDIGRANMVGKYYSSTMSQQAHDIIHDELVNALRMKLSRGTI